jgi:tetratricopeptide (TPR) repeat protein
MAEQVVQNSSHVPLRPGAGKPKGRRVLDLRVLLGTLVVAAVLTPTLNLWRTSQIKRTSAALLVRADELERQEKWSDAAAYLHRYLKLQPDNPQVLVRLARTFDKSAAYPAAKQRAVELYYQALGVASPEEEPALRHRLVDLLSATGNYPAAQTEVDKVLAANPNDNLAYRQRAFALFGQARAGALDVGRGRPEEVGEAFLAAIEHNPNDIGLSATLARIYRQQPQWLPADKSTMVKDKRIHAADSLIDAMVAAHPDDASARSERFLYRLQFDLPLADDDLRVALEKAPNEVSIVLLAAEYAMQQAGHDKSNTAKLQEARGHYQRALELAPKNDRAFLGLGSALWALNQPEEAIETWRGGLKALGGVNVSICTRLTEALLALGRQSEAEQTLDALARTVGDLSPSLSPGDRQTLEGTIALLRGKLLMGNNDFRGAAVWLERAAHGQRSVESEARQTVEASLLLGGVQSRLGQWDEAALAYEQAARLAPRMPQAYLGAATAWLSADRPDRTIQHLQQALSLDSRPEAWLSLAQAHLRQQSLLTAETRNWEAFRRAMDAARKGRENGSLENPWRIELLEAEQALLDLASSKGIKDPMPRVLGLLAAAEKDYPDAPEVFHALTTLYERLGMNVEADRSLARWEQLAGHSVATWGLRCRLACNRSQYDEARKLVDKALAVLPSENHAAIRYELVRIELEQGHVAEAQKQLASLLEADPKNLELVRQLAELAVQTNDLAALRSWEQRLLELETDGCLGRYYTAQRMLAESQEPTDTRLAEAETLIHEVQSRRPAWPAAHVLHAQILEKRGRKGEAVDAYREAVRLGERGDKVFARLIALLLADQRFTVAEEYRRLATACGVRLPSAGKSVSLGLSPVDVVKLYADAAKTDPAPGSAIALATVLLESGAQEASMAVADPVLQEAIAKHAKSVELLFCVANLRASQQKPDDAIGLYRRVLQQDPKHVLALNNLATLLSEKPEAREEALDCVDRAIKLVGPAPPLLDTKGMILVYQGRTAEALTTLEKAAVTPPHDPRHVFHLAVAYNRSGNPDKAKAALERARRMNLDRQILVESDRKQLAELEQNFGK